MLDGVRDIVELFIETPIIGIDAGIVGVGVGVYVGVGVGVGGGVGGVGGVG